MLRIEIGGDDGYGYVGVQSPLTEEQAALLQPLEFTTTEPTYKDGDPWSETKFLHSPNSPGPEEVSAKQRIRTIGQEVTQKLREGGFEVEIDETVLLLTWGRELFDSRLEAAGQLH
jgi:hypothetical protein